MWIWEQKHGVLRHDDDFVSFGYSGFGNGKNNPDMENLHDVGPIPKGRYTIETIVDGNNNPIDYEHKKAPVFRLVPAESNEMFGRAGFLIHGDSISAPGTASHGCVIENHLIRMQILESGDKELEVV